MVDAISRLTAALEDRYRIERKLGEGGMATVYLARDERHKRNVALKVLKPELAAVVGAERFLAEIRTTANLQHPHILPLFDSGEAEGFVYYVMPYVEGESLRERLTREKQLPVEEAVQIAKHMAEALDYAHRQGIIHRDIKPANVLLQDGKPVIADFGIALAVGAAGGGRLTETGLSLGTPHYMSPEQGTGDLNVGPATDIWALGCVLYELLAGEPPFTGSTAQAVLGSIVAGEADRVSERRPSVPPHVDSAVARALERVPADRFRTASQFVASVSDPAFRHGRGFAAARAPGSRASVPVLVALALVLGAIAAWGWFRPVEADPVHRFTIPVHAGYLMETGEITKLAVSPDGRTVIYGNGHQLFRRDLDSFDERAVAGSEYAVGVFFSHDGESLGFGRGQGLWRVDLASGNVLRISPDMAGSGAHWTASDLVVYSAAGGTQGIRAVAANGGDTRQLTRPSAADGAMYHRYPQLLPGDRLLYTALGPSLGWSDAAVIVQDVDTGEATTTLTGAAHAQYLPTGHLVYSVVGEGGTGTLTVAPFDLGTLQLGPATPVATGVRIAANGTMTDYAVSPGGTLAYVLGSTTEMQLLTWLDRRGVPSGVVGSALTQFSHEISPDGAQIATSIRSPNNSDVWTLDARTGVRERLTFALAEDETPVWSSDGGRIAYSSSTSAQERHIYVQDMARPDSPRVVYTSPNHMHLTDWSIDDRYIVFNHLDPESGWDIWALELGDSVRAFPVVSGEPVQMNGRLSPDGRWLAYQSNENEELDDVFVVSFPQGSGRRQVSQAGGTFPRWSADGRELFFCRFPGGTVFSQSQIPYTFVAVTIEPGEALSVGAEAELFEGWCESYDVHPDGRFLVAAPNPEAAAREIHIVANWFEELRQKVGR